VDVSGPSDSAPPPIDGGPDADLPPDVGPPDVTPPSDVTPAPDLTPPADVSPPPDVADPPPAPTFPHFDTLIDAFRENLTVWAYFGWVDEADGELIEVGYADTAHKVDFWPASTIKVFTATAALVLLKAEGMTLDALATFYHHDGDGWVEDVSKTVRQLIFESFNCSSNSAYTLLLRLAGADWLNTAFLLPEQGFEESALMSGYVSDRPFVYHLYESQRIVLADGENTIERIHDFSGESYSDAIGCTVGNSDHVANCTSTRDLAEHLRRLMHHEQLAPEQRFDVDPDALDWMRYGGPEPVMNNAESCGGPGWAGVSAVLPSAAFYHKGGAISSYRLDAQYVDDDVSGTRYFFAVATDTGSSWLVEKLSEEVARMAVEPRAYVHLDFLSDHVNPVVADLVVYSEQPATLDLVTKAWSDDPDDAQGWTALPGAIVEVPSGISAHTLTSDCLASSGKIHIRGRLTADAATATSDLHYVIVDADLPCP